MNFDSLLREISSTIEKNKKNDYYYYYYYYFVIIVFYNGVKVRELVIMVLV